MLFLRLKGLLGLLIFILLAYILSENRKRIDWRLVVWGLGLQFVFALLILKTQIGFIIFDAARIFMTRVILFSNIGAEFLFGKLVSDQSIGATIAFQVLPIIIFVSAIMSVLYYFRIIQFFVNAMAKLMQKTMKISGAESFTTALFVFMGIETITAIRGYIHKMTRSELFTIMVAFMATIAGSVMAAYVSFGAKAGHLLAASLMSAPAAVLISKVMIPESEEPQTLGEPAIKVKSEHAGVIDALAGGALEGLKLASAIGAMLIVFISTIGMFDFILNQFSWSFGRISSYLFWPIAYIIGVPAKDCLTVGELLGIKVIFNEFISYLRLKPMIAAQSIDPRSITLATYALCSFANFGSIAILIGGIGGLVPERRSEVASLGIRALVAGAIAGFMTAAVVGLLI